MSGEIKPVGGDRVIVVSGNKYVGELEYKEGTRKFEGDITDATVGEKLKFYFLGNVTPQYTMDGANKVGCSVVISDQTNSGNRPVISANVSNENYDPSTTDYSSELQNQCSLVKFNVTTSSPNVATCITGFNNKVTVDFGENTLTPSKEGNGLIKLAAGNGEKWAVLLPQAPLAEDGEEEYSFYTDDHCYIGTRPAIDEIGINGLYNAGINLVVTTENFVDLGSGVLWAKCNLGADFHSPKAYGDYFAWGETAPKDTYTWNTYKYCNGTMFTLTKYCFDSDFGTVDGKTILDTEDDAAAVNWGNGWRMPTQEEWEALQDKTRTWTNLNGVKGVSITGNGNTIFIPAGGYKLGSDSSDECFDTHCCYWTTSLNFDEEFPQMQVQAFQYMINGSTFTAHSSSRSSGCSVRPVRDARPQN